ncbi:MAG: family 10 glycosylhydrolase [Symploca sp. SIO2C1]|nr:family 10 glycosylhydrolase [Symploca sp. SIO2C1]
MKRFLKSLLTIWVNELVSLKHTFGRPAWLVFLFVLGIMMALWKPTVAYPQTQFSNIPENGTQSYIEQLPQQQVISGSAEVPTQYIAHGEISTPNNTELRGVWLTNIDSDVLFSSENTTSALQLLKQLNFNTVYPTVWNWGYTLYPSKIAKGVIGELARIATPLEEPFEPELGLKGRDVLQEIVKVGHQQDMRVIPWFEFGFMAPSDSELAKHHPDWLTQNAEGVKTKQEGTHERVWLNPFMPEVQQFIQNLAIEIVSNYDIDGLQFDDHFGLPSDLGYDDFTVELYKQEHQGTSPPTDSKDPEWLNWRANKITDFLKQMVQAIKDRKQEVIISISPNPQRFSYQFFLADWENWVQLGLVDELIVQIYRDSFESFISELQQPEVKAAHSRIPVSIGILTGLKNKSVSMSQIRQQVEAVRNRGFAGVSFFFYETLLKLTEEPLNQRQTDFGLLFPMPAEAPEVTDWE